ncbi:MAG: hypothetical protein LBT53_05380 [Puniceicoccales bacterium]|jgi:hypothetical protein|nr:hypothetical protein [Puniceicoccales bacterium]
MRKLFLALGASCALVAAAFAGPLNTHGIPADAIGVFHADVEALNKTESFKSAMSGTGFLRRELVNKGIPAQIKKLFGFDQWAEVRGFTVGVLPPFPKTAGEKTPNAATPARRSHPETPAAAIWILRGNFDQGKIRANIAQKEQNEKSAKPLTVGSRKFIEVEEGAFLLLVDKETGVLVTEAPFGGSRESGQTTKILKAVADAFDGKTKSYAPPPSLAPLGAQTGTPAILAYFDFSSLKIPEPLFPSSIHLALGNAAGTLKLRTLGGFESEEGAAQALIQLRDGLGHLNAQIARELRRFKEQKQELGGKSEILLQIAKEVSKVLSVPVINGSGKNITFNMDYSDASLVNLAKLVATASRRATGDTDVE